MEFLFVAIGLAVVLLIGYTINSVIKSIKSKPKVVKSKEKPQPKNKEEDKLKINDFRPIVKEATESEKNESSEELFVDDLGREPEINFEEEVKKDGYVPSWDRKTGKDYETKEDEEKDDLEEFRHFPSLSHMIMEGDTLSERIKNLPDDIKALLLTDALKRKDD